MIPTGLEIFLSNNLMWTLNLRLASSMRSKNFTLIAHFKVESFKKIVGKDVGNFLFVKIKYSGFSRLIKSLLEEA